MGVLPTGIGIGPGVTLDNFKDDFALPERGRRGKGAFSIYKNKEERNNVFINFVDGLSFRSVGNSLTSHQTGSRNSSPMRVPTGNIAENTIKEEENSASSKATSFTDNP